MVKDDRRHVQVPDQHEDGDNEGPISDPFGGPKIGIRSDLNPQHPYEQKNPYGHVTLKPDKKMEEFQTLFRK